MYEVQCELCPVSSECHAYRKTGNDNDNSHHPQNVVRVSCDDCPLVFLLQEDENAK